MNANYKTIITQKRHLQIVSAVCLSAFLFATASFAQTAELSANGKIAFYGLVKGHYDVFVMNSDGTGQTNITNSPDQDEISPSWSPDGKKLAFLYALEKPYYVLGFMDADGSNKTFLVQVNLPALNGDTLSWSPDSKKIAFTSYGEIFTVNTKGGEYVDLTNDPRYEKEPSWSPDGSKIAFSRQQKDGSYRVFTMNPDGSKIERSPLGGFSGASTAKYSPDAKGFLYFNDLGNKCSCLISATTDGKNNLVLDFNSSSADWSPDGKQIVLSRFDGSSSRIYVMKAGGGYEIPIGPKGALQPDWQPLPATEHDGEGANQ